MPTIKPISDLRNKSREISRIVHDSDEPVYITKGGEGDMVVMSMRHYGRLLTKVDLLSKLAVAQAQKAAGDKGRPWSQVSAGLRRRIHEGQ